LHIKVVATRSAALRHKVAQTTYNGEKEKSVSLIVEVAIVKLFQAQAVQQRQQQRIIPPSSSSVAATVAEQHATQVKTRYGKSSTKKGARLRLLSQRRKVSKGSLPHTLSQKGLSLSPTRCEAAYREWCPLWRRFAGKQHLVGVASGSYTPAGVYR
jgi:hypothetical protein